MPSSQSGVQSNIISAVISAFINDAMPSKEVETIGPKSIDFAPDTRFVGADKAVVGTTKLIVYNLTYEEKEGAVKDGSVTLTFDKTPGEGSFTYVHTPINSSKGAVRITPLKEGDFKFTIADNYGVANSFSLSAVERLEPTDMVFPEEAMELEIGGYECIDYSLVSESYTLPETGAENSELVDHYLQRFFDPALSNWATSDPSVCLIDDYGFVKGVGSGTASITWNGKTVRDVHVNSSIAASSPFTMAIDSAASSIHPLDYDYYNANERYGIELNPTFSDGNSHPVHWFSSDPLIAMVNNEHIEYDHTGAAKKVSGGFVSGYRKTGSATITAVAVEDPSIQATFEVTSEYVSPSSFSVSANKGGTAVSLTEVNEFDAGSVISLSGTFTPKNASNQVLHVELSDSTLATIGNNDTSAPNIRLDKEGALTATITCPYIENSPSVAIEFKIKALPYISESDMPAFSLLVRKSLGHFTLFAGNGVFFMLAIMFTLFIEKPWGIAANFGISCASGFALGGLSELIQAIPALKRGASMADVLIDTMGFVAGAMAVAIGFVIAMVIIYLNRRKRPSA
ncbi:MAG: hypothetical protein K6F32_04125 [Bacilli bacterium]|nr:hypothetical protein [Bacilli bacterium]